MARITITTDDGEIIEAYTTSTDARFHVLGHDFDVEKPGHWGSLAQDIRDDLRRALAREEVARIKGAR
tara:strand:+ start:599 stop:802 length:204 start_codon:yes stop_codon:yes gene_type:complete